MPIALDIETTGLPSVRRAKFDNTRAYDTCRVLSLACVEYTPEGIEFGHTHSIVYPDTFEVAATEIHGITTEVAQMDGRPFKDVYNELLTILATNGPDVIGHNISFDITTLKAEAYRRGLDWQALDSINQVCTFQLSKTIYMRPMKLGQMYETIFNAQIVNAHNALADARASGEIYFQCMKSKHVKPIQPKKVIIRASDLAACIDMNRFRPSYEVLCDMWKKYSPDTFTGQTKAEVAKELSASFVPAQPQNVSDVERITTEMNTRIDTDQSLTTEQKVTVKEYVRKTICTSHGIQSEDRTAEKLGTVLKDDTYYTMPITSIAGTTYELCGKIDGYEINQDGSRTLIEIKNRVNRLFKTVQKYEMVQVQAYLQMTNLELAKLVEQYKDDVSIALITKNQTMWDTEIFPKLCDFCHSLHLHMSD